MDVSVLIGKPLGALRPSPPITAWEEVNTHSRTGADERRWSEGQSAASTPRPCHPQPERRRFRRLICLRQGSGIVRIITRAVIITVLSGTYGREQPLRALSQTQPNWLGLISGTGTHCSALWEASITVPADGDEETDTFWLLVSNHCRLQQGGDEGGQQGLETLVCLCGMTVLVLKLATNVAYYQIY